MCCSVQQHHVQYIVERCSRLTRVVLPRRRHSCALRRAGVLLYYYFRNVFRNTGRRRFILVRSAKAFSKLASSYAYVGYLNNPVTRGRAAGATAIQLAPYSSGFNVFTVHQK